MNIRKHIGYYVAFGLVMLLGLVLIAFSSANRQLQLFTILAMAGFYFTFAIVHHIQDHDLTTKIVIEYALVGCLGLAVSMFALI